MKFITFIACIFICSCSSLVGLNENKNFAYIFTNQLAHTPGCNGESLIIVGVRQENHVAVDMLINSIYIPKGKNYIYYNKIFESSQNGKCKIGREILIRHSEFSAGSRLQYRPWGEEIEVNVEGGEVYFLTFENGNPVAKKSNQ